MIISALWALVKQPKLFYKGSVIITSSKVKIYFFKTKFIFEDSLTSTSENEEIIDI